MVRSSDWQALVKKCESFLSATEQKIISTVEDKLRQYDDLSDVEVTDAQLEGLVVQESGEKINVQTDADEVTIIAKHGNQITIQGDVGIVRIETGDGAIINFESSVGGANITQGNGSNASFFAGVTQIDVAQGEGSEVVTFSKPVEVCDA